MTLQNFGQKIFFPSRRSLGLRASDHKPISLWCMLYGTVECLNIRKIGPLLWQQKIKLHKWWMCLSKDTPWWRQSGVYIYPHVRYYTACIRDETMNGGTNKTLSRENIVPLTSFRIYLNDPLWIYLRPTYCSTLRGCVLQILSVITVIQWCCDYFLKNYCKGLSLQQLVD